MLEDLRFVTSSLSLILHIDTLVLAKQICCFIMILILYISSVFICFMYIIQHVVIIVLGRIILNFGA